MKMEFTEYSIEVTTHGRYLLDGAGAGKAMLVGFHGYGESAEIQLNRLRTVAGLDRWMILSIQGLHRFYRRSSDEIVASWMTRQGRELAIQDNCSYVAKVVDAVTNQWNLAGPLVLSGFSQGVSMAFRAAATLGKRVSGVIALGGDVPPEIEPAVLSRIPAVLIGSGNNDEWYTANKAASDERRLRSAGVSLQVCSFDGGHEWTPAFAQAASRFLDDISTLSP
jgi:predicted esterase